MLCTEKRKFDDWDILPLNTTKEIGKRLDDELKDRLHEAVNEMFLELWEPVYSHANTTLLEWVEELAKYANIQFEMYRGTPAIICNLIPADLDRNFCIKIPIIVAASQTAEWLLCDEENEDERKAIADALRAAADTLYG